MSQVSDKSTLAELRAFLKENNIDVKTAGPGRTKAAILADVLMMLGNGTAGETALAEMAAAGEAAPSTRNAP